MQKSNTLPTFPQFSKLDINHKELIQDFFERFPVYSEYGFANMFIWDVTKPVYISLLNNNLIIRFVNFEDDQYYLSIIGNHKINPTVATLIDHAEENGYHKSLKTLPESTVKNIDPNKFEIIEDIDNNDYIISTDLLATLQGSKIEDKRYKVNIFNVENKHKNITFSEIDLHDKSSREKIRKILREWAPPSKASPKSLLYEYLAVEKLFSNLKNLENIYAYGVYENDNLVAFNIIEKVHDQTVIGHFEKADRSYKGLYEYMNHNLCKILSSEGYKYLNICQDMGIEGLRNSKMSYYPVNFHRKYTVKRAEGSHAKNNRFKKRLLTRLRRSIFK